MRHLVLAALVLLGRVHVSGTDNTCTSTAVAHSGGFSAGDARKWLKIDRPDVQRAAGSPTPGPTADSSAMLMSNTRNRYMFFASFGGAAGMRAAVKAAMLAERARMAAIQEAICGPLEVHL